VDIDDEVRALREQLAASSGSEPPPLLVLELVIELSDRYALRLAAGQPDLARDDLEEAIQRLTVALERTDRAHVLYQDTAWMTAMAYRERWIIADDPADRDQAIAVLSAALAARATAPGPVDAEHSAAELHAALARLLSSRYAGSPAGPGQADLEAAIGHARAGLRCCAEVAANAAAQEAEAAPEAAEAAPEAAEAAPEAEVPRGGAHAGEGALAGQEAAQEDTAREELTGELRTLLGLALADRCIGRVRPDSEDAGVLAERRSDREEAIAAIESGGWPPASADGADEAGPDPAEVFIDFRLGQLYLDRYFDESPGASGAPNDLDAAISALSSASAAEPDREIVDVLVLALSERYDASDGDATRDELIRWGRLLLELPGEADGADDQSGGADDQSGLRVQLAQALLGRAEDEPLGRLADLDAAIEYLEADVGARPIGDRDRAILAGLLAQTYLERQDGSDANHAAIDRMTGCAREAWHHLPPDADGKTDRLDAGLCLAVGIFERLRRPGEPFDHGDADLAVSVLRQIEPFTRADPGQHATVVTILAQFLVGRAQALGSASALREARPWVLKAIEEVEADDPASAELAHNAAAVIAGLATLGLSTDDVDQAIEVLTAAVARSSGRPDPGLLEALGGLLVRRSMYAQDSRLDSGIQHLSESWSLLPAGDPNRIRVAANLGAALIARFNQRGDTQDLDAAELYLDAARALADSRPGYLETEMPDARVIMAATRGQLKGLRAISGLDRGAGAESVAIIREALGMMPADHPLRAHVRSDLGLILVQQATNTAELMHAASELKAAAEELPPGSFMRPAALLRAGGALAVVGQATRDLSILDMAVASLSTAQDELDPRSREHVRFTVSLGLAYRARYLISQSPADLVAAVSWLEEGRLEFAGRPGHPQFGLTLTELARCYRARQDRAAAREAGLAALREHGREVLLQTGTARSLHFASVAADKATEVTGWCLEDGEVAAAVAALELGRSLVLHAATAVTSVADLLRDAGRDDLAGEWAGTMAAPHDAPWDRATEAADFGAALLAAGSLEVPAALRARTLDALAGTSADQLLAPPGCADIAAALAETNADALVYLLDPASTEAGRAIIVRRGGDVELLALPLLHDSLAGPLTEYAGLADAGPRQERWSGALEQLCDWAWPTVMAPLLQRATQWGLGRPPRLVLIPGGRLSLVPWHAARMPSGVRGPTRYACSTAVLSYASSGRQLIEVSRRPALPVQADPVVIGNPGLTLPYGAIEGYAIVQECYPAARYLGRIMPGWARRADGPGQPAEVLGELPSADHAGASMIHLGCHAMQSAAAPGQSYLQLAGGKLTVETILRQASGRPPTAPGGLVSLAACSSDHGGGAYDEALTLATAFLAAGAVTVTGARWVVGDQVTVPLMFMFHHYLAADGHGPRDALRLAQLWMLDPTRKAPAQMPPEVSGLVTHLRHPDIASWAAFTHQGR
jgi:CHAT domain